MYAGPDIVRTGVPRRTGLFALPTVLAVCCLGFLLFLIAVTIVVALIPIYLPRNTAATNPNAFRTQPIRMMVPAAGVTGRRRQTTSDTLSDDDVGSTFGADGLTQTSNLIGSSLSSSSSSNIQSASVSSVSVVYAGSGSRKRRFALSKRQFAIENTIFLLVEMTLTYVSGCARGCQSNGAASLRESIYNLPLANNIFFSNVPLFKGGIFRKNIRAIQLARQRCRYVSPVLVDGSSGSSSDTAPPTALLTSTAAATTALTG